MGCHCIGIVTAGDSFSPYCIDEVAVLTPDRISFRPTHGPTGTDIDHDVMVCQFDRQPVRKDVEADLVVPTQYAGRGNRTENAGLECQAGGGYRGTSKPG